VPPDQSGTTSPAATIARSVSCSRIAVVSRVTRVPTLNTSTSPTELMRWVSLSSASA
jgi:hypothetical protein